MAHPLTAARICRLSRFEEFRGCEKIQQNVWGSVGVGAEVLNVTANYGGEVLGAFVGRGLRGFLYAFLARRHGKLIHWSHMMAVEPQFRNAGLGFRMKLAHRRRALAAGIHAICWTYDPLQSRNATLNIARLGGSAEEYIPDCYGPFPSRIEKGLASDRLVVEWAIASRRVAARLRRRLGRPPDPSWPIVNITRKNLQGFPENRAVWLPLRAPRLMVEIPADTDSMRLRALPLARRWRMEAREIFQTFFRAGYRVTDFFPPSRANRRCFYLLERRFKASKA
jgi:predicted GNAT superfamily acetyltransferase